MGAPSPSSIYAILRPLISKNFLAANGCALSVIAFLLWSIRNQCDVACALGSRLRFHRLDRLGHLCLLHSFFEPPVPLVFIPLHHGLHLERSWRRCSPSCLASPVPSG